ncbi:MAG: MFS transporter [Thermoplasmata archaeon]
MAATERGPSARAGPEGRVLQTLDEAHVGRFHLRSILVAGIGFFTDAYDLFVIGLAIPILVAQYEGGVLQAIPIGLLASAALIGAVLGPVVFGLLADRWGRRRVYLVTLSILIVGAVGGALSVPAFGLTTIGVLTLWRFVLGIGIGGEYPLSAAIVSEYANRRNRGRLIASVFAMQGFGLLTGAAVSLAVVYGTASLDVAWRIILGAGAIPAILTMYFRLGLPETPRFSLAQGRREEAARTVDRIAGTEGSTAASAAPAGDGAPPPLRPRWGTILRTYGTLIAATAVSWFLVDAAFYSTNIFNPVILSHIGFAASAGASALAQVRALAIGNVLLALIAAVPGYWAAVYWIDRVGRRPLQAIGFAVMAIAFALLALVYGPLVAVLPVFLVVYGLTFFFGNFGPNTTTFVYPSEVFPTSFRTTGHGIAAGAGKAGAVVAVILFPTLLARFGLPWFFGLLAAGAAAGAAVTVLVLPETSQRTLEAASGEDELAVLVRQFSTYLRALSLTIAQGAEALRHLLAHPEVDRAAQIARIRAIEHESDEEVHRIYVELNHRTLAGEVRSDVGHLASALDDIMDGIESVSARVETYDLTTPRPELDRFSAIVIESVEAVGRGILALDELDRGETEGLTSVIVEVNRLENEADDLLRRLLSDLFHQSRDPIEILKWKDFYERLEVITDRCEDVTDVFQDLVVRYAPVR